MFCLLALRSFHFSQKDLLPVSAFEYRRKMRTRGPPPIAKTCVPREELFFLGCLAIPRPASFRRLLRGGGGLAAAVRLCLCCTVNFPKVVLTAVRTAERVADTLSLS